MSRMMMTTTTTTTTAMMMMMMMTTMLMMMMMSMLTSRSWNESTVELFLDELAELDPAKVAPELKKGNINLTILIMIQDENRSLPR